MSQQPSFCPHVGLDEDRSSVYLAPTPAHRCYAKSSPFAPNEAHQQSYCLSCDHTSCGIFAAVAPSAASSAASSAALNTAQPESIGAGVNTSSAAPDFVPMQTAGSGTNSPNRRTLLGSMIALSALLLVLLLGFVVYGFMIGEDNASADDIRNSPSSTSTVIAEVRDSEPLPRRDNQDNIAVDSQIGSADSSGANDNSARLVRAQSSDANISMLSAGVNSDEELAQAETAADLSAAAPATATPTAQQAANEDQAQTQEGAESGNLLVRNPYITPTPLPDGSVLTFQPSPLSVAWYSNEGARRNYLGDSFLYAGTHDGHIYTSAMQFDLSPIVRGTSIEEIVLVLTGLNDERFASDVSTEWKVELIAQDAFNDNLGRADFLGIYSMPAAIQLPSLSASQLAVDSSNRLTLDRTTISWIESQILNGATRLTVRLSVDSDSEESLFAWDSGAGTRSAGTPPNLIVSMNAAPLTPPPLPTKPYIVATLTPIPENVLTVVARGETATAVATTVGTYTPLPYDIYTPTAFPENLPTVQAEAVFRGLAPVILPTETPANQATAAAHIDYATAVARTTGTATATPEAYVTPILLVPSPPAENAATAAVRAATATSQVLNGDPTATPYPYNAVFAQYVYATPTLEGVTVAEAIALETAAAETTGTPTPLPWGSIVITAVPRPGTPLPTPVPLLVQSDNWTPTPTATAPPNVLPNSLRNKILYLSDRLGGEEPALFAYDPASGQTFHVTQDWVLPLAQMQLPYSPEGTKQAIVKGDQNGYLQVHVFSSEYGSTQQIVSFGESISYDPAWSPNSGTIAFVSAKSGNDEIYTVNENGEQITQLTFNSWEWDKHPSWSPDGSQIVFFSNRTGNRQIWIMNADGSNQRNLSNNAYNDWDPIWTR